ncbi:acyl-CoA thioesterase [Roseisolibacter agri]|uniref:Thioesterase n=1 Tax=Roseisolibacter agri TaxID=2014610 RepID=A0AA37QAS0_9BACT|nr:thioesterase family protein [Roseisolibacter agri]GLC26236.1 thioesterase [Roseisolibacter agri]
MTVRAPDSDDAPAAAPPGSSDAGRDTFARTLEVAESDLDEQAHVNNVVYVQWVQDTATAHWLALTTPEDRAQVGWVCTRHEIDYLAPALLGDAVVVRTRVGHAKGLIFERHTDVRRVDDDRVLARSRTLWCPVDPTTGRPRRVPPHLRALFSIGEPAREVTDGDAPAR